LPEFFICFGFLNLSGTGSIVGIWKLDNWSLFGIWDL